MAGIGNFAFFAKIVEIIKIFGSHPKKDVAVAETHFLTYYRSFYFVYCGVTRIQTFKVLFYAETVGVVTSGPVTKMAVTPFDPQLPITPCYTQTSRLYLL